MKRIVIKITSDKGRGVFATEKFKSGEAIEICPVICLSPKEAKICEQTILDNYIYEWKSPRDGAVVLGYGSLYNHSYSPNAEYVRDFTRKTMVYRAIKEIENGEEILINYNGEPHSTTALNIDGVPDYE